MSFDELVRAVAERLDIGEIEPRENREYWLYAADGLSVTIFQNEDREIVLRSEIGVAPADDGEGERALRQILHWNFGRVKTQRATLSLAPEDGSFWLHQRLPAEAHLTVERLLKDLEHFFNCAEFWKTRLAKTHEAPQPAIPMFFR